MAVQFGVVTTPGSYGYIQNFSVNKTTEVGEARDENGDVAAYNCYNEKKECSFEYVFDGTAPSAGDTLQADDTNYFVLTSVTLTEDNQGYKTLSCQGTHYITNTLPAS